VPDKYADAVLTNFAAMLYKANMVDDALVMAKEAIKVNDKDPNTNFMLANIYMAKVNRDFVYKFLQNAL